MERDLSRSNKWNPIVTAPSDIRPSSVMARWGWSNRNTRLRRNWLLGKQNNIDHSLFNLIYITTQQFKTCHKKHRLNQGGGPQTIKDEKGRLMVSGG
jgi:hypothetical protein